MSGDGSAGGPSLPAPRRFARPMHPGQFTCCAVRISITMKARNLQFCSTRWEPFSCAVVAISFPFSDVSIFTVFFQIQAVLKRRSASHVVGLELFRFPPQPPQELLAISMLLSKQVLILNIDGHPFFSHPCRNSGRVFGCGLYPLEFPHAHTNNPPITLPNQPLEQFALFPHFPLPFFLFSSLFTFPPNFPM